MEVSKLTIKAPVNARSMDILRFMHNESIKNPNFLRDTAAKVICMRYNNSLESPRSFSTILNTFLRLIKNGFIFREKRDGRRYNFKINYLNPAIPKEWIRELPQTTKDDLEKLSERLKQAREKKRERILRH